MFGKGDYVVYGLNGTCQVVDITQMSIPGGGPGRNYYVLKPVFSDKSTIYCPVDNAKVKIRTIISREEAEGILTELSEINEVKINSEKLREAQYKEIMGEGDIRSCIALMKTLIEKRTQRFRQGRKFTSVDERYLKGAGDMVSSEMAVALGDSSFKMEKAIQQVTS